MTHRPASWIVPLLAAGVFVCCAAPTIAAPAVLVIDRGGTYRGSWRSDDPAVPVVLIRTPQPVVLDGCTLIGRGTLIATQVEHCHVIVRNCHGIGLNPDIRGKHPGRFFDGEAFDSITIENNDIENTSGIIIASYAGDFAPQHTAEVLRNRARNIDGRESDGKGGYLNRTIERQFVQIARVRHLGGIEIAWNEIINEPGKSGVEDVISVFRSSGTKADPIRLHDNYIQGAYPPDPLSKEYSGGGIMLADGSAASLGDACGFVEAYDNQVIDTTNYGISISAGHDCIFHHNRIVSTGFLPDGRPLPAQNVGASIWDPHHDRERQPATFFNNSGYDNLIGWTCPAGRNDWWVPEASSWKDNRHWPGAITAQTVADERERWQRRLNEEGIHLGPRAP